MNLEMGFFPKSYVSGIPEAGGFFPFAIDGNTPYIGDYQTFDDGLENFLCKWLANLDRFPIYAVFEYMDFQQDEIEKDFSLVDIEYLHFKFKKELFIKAKLTSFNQLQVVMPYLYGQGSMNYFAAWSLSEDLFSFDKRDMKTLFGTKKVQLPVINLKQDCTVFWVCYDGDSIVSISNEKLFSTVDSITGSFPPGINVTECEFEE